MSTIVIGSLIACSGKSDDGNNQPFIDDTGSISVGTFFTQTTTDSGGGGGPITEDNTPVDFINIHQFGVWTMSGSDMTGTLNVQEWLEPLDPLATDPYECDVVFSVTGQAPQPNAACGNCDAEWDVEFFATSGDPSACREPDSPFDGATWRLGWVRGQNMVVREYNGTGVWLDWLPVSGVAGGTTLTLDFLLQIGIELEDSGT